MACDADHGHAPIGFSAKQMVHDGFAHRAGRARFGLDVHEQARPGVHLHDGTVLRGHGFGDVGDHQVHPCHVQAHHAGGHGGEFGHIGVHQVGHVVGEVAVALHTHALPRVGHAVGRQTLALQLHQHVGFFGQHDEFQRKFFFFAPAWVGVELLVHQLLHGVLAVGHHFGGLAACGGHHAAAHHQQAVFFAGNAALHDHAAALFVGHHVGGVHVGFGHQVKGDASAVVAVNGFHGHGQANVLGCAPGGFGGVDLFALGHRNATGGQQGFGQVFVAANAFGNGTGAIGFGGPDAALLHTLAQLHQVAVVQPGVWDAACGGRVHDVGGAGP